MLQKLIMSALASLIILGSMVIIPIPFVKSSLEIPCYCGGPPDWQATRESVYGWPFHFQEKIDPLYGSGAYKRWLKSYQISLIEDFLVWMVVSYAAISMAQLIRRNIKQ